MTEKSKENTIVELECHEIELVSGGHDWVGYAQTTVTVAAAAIAVWSAIKSSRNE